MQLLSATESSWLIGGSAFGIGLFSPYSSTDALLNYAFAPTARYNKRAGIADHLWDLHIVVHLLLGSITL